MVIERTRAELIEEITRLESKIQYWKRRCTELEERLGITLPFHTELYRAKPVRLIVLDGEPLVLASDALAQLRHAPPRYTTAKVGEQVMARFRRLGLGKKEAIAVKTSILAEQWNTTEGRLATALGWSRKVHAIAFITQIGVTTLADKEPKFCAWLGEIAIPAARAKLGGEVQS